MKVAFLIPSHRGLRCVPFVKSLIATVELFTERGHQPTMIRLDGCSNLQFGRNSLESSFLSTDAEAAFLLDDDLSWKAEDALRLLEADGEFVSVAYRHKRQIEAYPTVLLHDENGRLIAREDGALATKFGTIGFARIMRSVYEKLISSYPERTYSLNMVHTNYDHHPQGIFDGVWVGEDYGFCRLWTGMGGEIWTIPDIDINHHGTDQDGNDVPHPGNLHRFLQRQPGGSEYPGPSIEAALKIDGWMSTAELEWLAQQATEHEQIVEIGSFRGRSTVALGANTVGTVYAIDNFYGPPDIPMGYEERKKLFDEFQANTEPWRVNGNIIPVVAQHSHKGLIPRVVPDMVFIDGSHDYESVKRDIEAWRGRITEGGLLCGHDYDWPGVRQAVNELVPGAQAVPGTSIWYAKEGQI